MTPFRGQYPNRNPNTALLKIGEMEQAYSEMPLAEPEPKFRLSRQHLCCHSERNQAYGERHSLKMDKKLHRPSARIYNPSIGKEGGHQGVSDCLPYRSASYLLTLLPRNLRFGQRFSEISCQKIANSEICIVFNFHFHAQ